MRKLRCWVAVGLGASTLAVSVAASAQPTKDSTAGGYTYDFEPDDLVGETLATTPPLIRLRRVVPRVMLLRPRASFVPEMLKSVEAL